MDCVVYTEYNYECPKCDKVTMSKKEIIYKCRWCDYESEKGLKYCKKPEPYIEFRNLLNLEDKIKEKSVKKINIKLKRKYAKKLVKVLKNEDIENFKKD